MKTGLNDGPPLPSEAQLEKAYARIRERTIAMVPKTKEEILEHFRMLAAPYRQSFDLYGQALASRVVALLEKEKS